MRRISTCSIALLCLLAFNQKSFGQTLTALTNTQCNTVNFTGAVNIDFNDNSPTNMAGFLGNGWQKVILGSNQYINVTPSAAQGTTFTLTTPTYTTGSPTLNLKFTIGGSSKVTSYTIYTETQNSTTTIGTVSGGASGVSGIQCLQIDGWNIAGNFRFIIEFNTDAGTDGKGTLTFDDFFLTRVISQAPLPVHFSSFNARSAGASVALTWNIEAEQNVKGYEVERSNDGRNFTNIGFVGAASQSSYSYTDNRPLASGYYRIKSVDIDGKFLYSTVISFKGGKSVVVLRAFMSNQNTLTIQHDAAQSGSRISISSADGRLIKSLSPSAGTQQTVVNVSSARAGLYLVRFDDGNGGVETLKVVKQQ